MRLPWSRPRPIREIDLAPPAPLPGRHGLAMVAIVRDEGPHLLEWARFHLAAGLRHLLLYDDLSRDRGPERLARDLGDRVTVVPWGLAGADAATGRPLHPQILAYAHALRAFGGRFARMAFLDADEFLVPVSAPTVEEALAATRGHPNVSLPWVQFGFGSHDAPPAEGTVASFRDRARDLRAGLNFKLVLDPCEVTRIGVHHALTRSRGGETVNDRGEAADYAGRKAPGFLSTTHLQLNHYFTRSRAEFEAKLARGSAAAKRPEDYASAARAKALALSRDTVRCDRAADFARRHGL